MRTITNDRPIAILMATYNSDKYLTDQIESIINQTNKEWTLYIRDDGSTDSTRDIIQKYAEIYENINVILDNKGNLGCRDNFFSMLNTVHSEYYMFSDADDVWLPQKIQVCIDEIKVAEDAHGRNTPILVHSDMVVVDSELKVMSKSMWSAAHFNPDAIKTFEYVGIHCFVGGATCLFNNAAKECSYPLSSEVYLHDLWIALNVIRKGIIISIHKQLLLYRQHSNNTAGAASSSNLKLISKLKNTKKVLLINIATARMLKKCGWGGYLKYLFYKIKLVYLIRSGKAL